MSIEAERDYYTDKIREQGYVNVPISFDPAEIEPAFSALRTVLDEAYETTGRDPSLITDAFANVYPNRPHDSAGFINQRRIGKINPYELGRDPATEDKDILQFTPRTPLSVAEFFNSRGGAPESVAELVGICEDIHASVKRAVLPALEALDINELLIADDPLEDIHVLRVIRYLGKSSTSEATVFKSDDNLAELHFDRAKFTTAIWESAPGLVGAPGNNTTGDPSMSVEDLDALAERALYNPIDHRANRVKLFPGAGYHYLPEATRKEIGDDLPILLHGVIDEQPTEERDAIVLFMNEHGGHNFGAPQKHETGFSSVRKHLSDEIMRHGGILPPSSDVA